MDSGPAIEYATSDTPRHRRGPYAIERRPDGLRIVYGPRGWGIGQTLVILLLACLPVAIFSFAVASLNGPSGYRTRGGEFFALFLIAVGVIGTLLVALLTYVSYASSKVLTEIRISPQRVTRTATDTRKMDLWPREEVMGFSVLIHPRNAYAALCLATHDGKNPILLQFLSHPDAHALAAAANAELARPIPAASAVTSPDDHVPPHIAPDA